MRLQYLAERSARLNLGLIRLMEKRFIMIYAMANGRQLKLIKMVGYWTPHHQLSSVDIDINNHKLCLMAPEMQKR